jgi:hypothetical protein
VSVNKCGEETEMLMKNILHHIPKHPSEEYLDFQNLQKQVTPLVTEVKDHFSGLQFFTRTI